MTRSARRRTGGCFTSISGHCFSYRGGRLCAERVPLERIAHKTGTPVYVYSAGAARARFAEFDGAFSSRKRLVCYALKANSNRAVCGLFARLGAGAEVVSGGELLRALAAGFPPERIVFSGVGKTADEHALALRRGILAVHVESAEELVALSRVARRLKRAAPFAVRLNPGVDALTHPHVATGRSGGKFGVGAPETLALYRRARRDPSLRAVGIHCHIGSQVMSVRPYLQAIGPVLRILRALERSGRRLDYIDLGGGMGVPYGGGRGFPLPELARTVLSAFRPWPGLRLLFEPGRFLTAEAGALLTRVLYRKAAGGRRIAVVDAGMNDLLRPALYGARHPIAPLRRSRGRPVRLDVVGPVCESADRFAKGASLPWPEPGELWAVLDAGAYGFSMSSQYNSRPRPPEALVDGSSWRLARSRERFEDLILHEL